MLFVDHFGYKIRVSDGELSGAIVSSENEVVYRTKDDHFGDLMQSHRDGHKLGMNCLKSV